MLNVGCLDKGNNKLFVAHKPTNISSNHFLRSIKRKYKVKKAGFSGTLDPFASGSLIMAFGQFTKLFQFLKKAPKSYKATLWLGASSPTLDIEKIQNIQIIKPLNIEDINSILKDLIGDIEYSSPKYSAKKVNGQKYYKLARSDIEFTPKQITSTIYDIHLISYIHPFLTFEISVSEGSYIRSIGAFIANKFNTIGSLSMLERLSEGKFKYKNEQTLNPIDFLNTTPNQYLQDEQDLLLGKKLNIQNLKIQDNGTYHIIIQNYLSIVKIQNNEVKYLLNRIQLSNHTQK